MYRIVALILLFGIYGTGPVTAQDTTERATQDSAQQQPESKAPAPQSDAERIARLERTIEENEKLLNDLKTKFEDSQGEFPQAKAEFNKLDEELQAKRNELEQLNSDGKAEQAAALQAEIEALEPPWKLAKERFDLLIEQRKTEQEQIATLDERIQQDRAALERLLMPTSQPLDAADQPPTTAPVQPAAQADVAPEAGEAPSVAPLAVPPGTAQVQPVTPPSDEVEEAPPSEEARRAQQEAQAAETEARIAEAEVVSVAQRIDQLRKQIEQEKTSLETARKIADNARQTERALNEQAQKRMSEGAPRDELRELWVKTAGARQNYHEARDEVAEHVARLEDLQAQLAQLQDEQIAALRDAEQKQAEAKDKRKLADWTKSPFYPPNLLKWLIERGPRVIGIILGIVVLLWLSRAVEGRIVRLLTGQTEHGSATERADRAQTLASVFRSAVAVVVVVGGLLMLLSEFGVPMAPLLGASAVVGVAVGFGAQNVVRDYFAGFMILLENQYGINDVVKVGNIGGLVERVTLRVTVLRGLDGTVHFIPNGQIATVSNMTLGWSRALFDIGVAYKEDVDQVMDVLVGLGKELRADPQFSNLILDDPEMLGVDSFGDWAVVIKFFIKTRPLQQWTVKRAMLRRIKKKFDELGIEIPFPYRTIYHRYEQGQLPPGTQIAAGPRVDTR